MEAALRPSETDQSVRRQLAQDVLSDRSVERGPRLHVVAEQEREQEDIRLLDIVTDRPNDDDQVELAASRPLSSSTSLPAARFSPSAASSPSKPMIGSI
jgi:hypothetical protein